MDTRSMYRDRLLRTLMIWTAITTLVLWLPAVRGLLDGDSYQWSTFGLRGQGTSGDYWLIVVCCILALTAQYLAWRGPRAPFYLLLAGWHLYLAVGALRLALENPHALRFRGDTLGIDVSIAIAAPVLFGIAAALVLWWITRDFRRMNAARDLGLWSRGNTQWTVALLALLPVQFVLLRFGPPHDLTDQIGVAISIVQWLLFSTAFRPRGPVDNIGLLAGAESTDKG